MDVTSLAESGATAIISAMATDAWVWARSEVAQLLSRKDRGREQEEVARLDGFTGELTTTAERDVHNRLHGYLEARLADDATVRNEFFMLVRKICIEVGLEPPTLRTSQNVQASNSVVVQTAGGDTHVHLVAAPAPVIRWAAMTGPEAARKLTEMNLADAVEALTDMEPALAARRLSHVTADRSQHLLSHMDEGIAAELLSKMTTTGQAAALLAGMEPSQAAAILDLTVADWTVARLAEMDPDRALVLLAAMGSKRTENLLAAMERQQTVRLLGAVSKVLTDQARVRTTLDLAQQEAERIAAQAREQARHAIERAMAEADAIRAAASTAVAKIGTAAPDDPGPEHSGADDPGRDRAPRLAAPGTTTASQDREPVSGSSGSAAIAVLESPRPVPTSTAPTSAAGEPTTHRAFALPTEYFLLGHDVNGRTRVDQAVLETGIVGALLCELAGAELLTIVDGELAPAASASCRDPIGEYLLARLANRRASISALVREVRKELFLRLVQRLADEGTVVPLTRTWPRSGVSYKPTSEAVAYEPAVRLVRFLLDSSLPPDDRTYLLAALVDITQLHRALPIDLRPRQVRELVKRLLKARNPGPTFDIVLKGVDASVAMLVVTPRGR